MSLLSYISLAVILDNLPTALLMFSLFRNRMRLSRGITAVMLAGMCGVILAATLYTFQPVYARGWIRMCYSMLVLLFSFSVYQALLRSTPLQVLFTMMVIKGYRDCISLFVDILRSYARNNPTLSLDSLTLYCSLTSLLIVPTMPFMLLFLEKCVRPITESDSTFPFWRFLWTVPASFYILFRLGVSPAYLNAEASLKGEFLLPYVWTLATFFTYFVILRMLSSTIHNAHLAERLHISSVQIAMQREIYESLRRTVEDTRRLRHDFRHHLAALKGYTDRNDCEGASRYLSSFLDDFRTDEPFCTNFAVDAIARHYVTLAKKAGADTDVVLELPQTLAVSESDLCVILGNLMENAVDACARQIGGGRFINVRAAIVGHSMIAVTVRNSYTGDIRRSGDVFLSSKRDGEGVGIASVRTITERCCGTSKFEYGDGIFTASILLNP